MHLLLKDLFSFLTILGPRILTAVRERVMHKKNDTRFYVIQFDRV